MYNNVKWPDSLTKHLVPNYKVVIASRRSAELERGNLLIGATHANLQRAQLHLRRRCDLRLLVINQLYLARLRKDGYTFHASLLSQCLQSRCVIPNLSEKGSGREPSLLL